LKQSNIEILLQSDEISLMVVQTLLDVDFLGNVLPDVLVFLELQEVLLHMEQFLILLIVGEVQDRYSILDLETEGVNQVVNDHYIVQASVLDDPQILDVKSVVGLHAVLSVEHPVDGLQLLVQVAHDRLSVVHRRGREYVNEEVLAHSLQKLQAVGSDVEPEHVAIQLQGHVGFLIIENRVDQGLVQVQNEQFLGGV
jgi:hypothetical protein